MNVFFHYINGTNISEHDRSRDGSPTGSAMGRSNSRKSRPVSSKANAIAKKKREMRENLEEAAGDLLAHFEHRNQDALMKVTRNTLESLKKRISSSSMLHYMGNCFILPVQLSSPCVRFAYS